MLSQYTLLKTSCASALMLIMGLHCQAGQDDDPVLEEALGFATFTQGQSKLGWLMNLNEVCSLQ